MLKRAHIRRRLTMLALLVAAASAACTNRLSPTGPLDDEQRGGTEEVIVGDIGVELKP